GETTSKFGPSSIRNGGLDLMVEVVCYGLALDTASEPLSIRPILGHNPMRTAGTTIFFLNDRHLLTLPSFVLGTEARFRRRHFPILGGIHQTSLGLPAGTDGGRSDRVQQSGHDR